MDKNTVVLSGSLAAVTQRPVGASGRTLVELKLAVTRPGRKGEGDQREVVPVIVWDATLGAALLALGPGLPLVVLGRISAREWQAPGGQMKTFVEVVAESVTVDATLVPSGEPTEAMASAPAQAELPVARAASRPSPRPSKRSDGDVPF